MSNDWWNHFSKKLLNVMICDLNYIWVPKIMIYDLVHKEHTRLNMFSIVSEQIKSLCNKQSRMKFWNCLCCFLKGRTSNVQILDLRMAPASYYLTAQWTQTNRKFPAFEKIPSDWYLSDGSFKPVRSNSSQGYTKIQFEILLCQPLLNFKIISNMWRYQIIKLKN